MKNLIISYATNCSFDDFYRFTTSARQACPADATDVVVFIDDLGDRFGRHAVANRITLVPVENVWKSVRRSRLLNAYYHLSLRLLRALGRILPPSHRPPFRVAYRHLVGAWVFPIAGRWLAYDTYLRVNTGYRMVMVSDLRDVIFQGCPFEGLDPSALHVFEQDGLRYGDDILDDAWYRAVYGGRASGRMAGRTTLCAGTVIGGHAPLCACVELLATEVQDHRRVPIDQPMLNDVVANRYGGKVVRHDLVSGPVLTLTGRHEGVWKLSDGRVLVGNRVAPVIHMYDRDAKMKEFFYDKYSVPHAPGA
jgi:hypothetical protein